jgi:hypothetical protein
MPYRLGREGLTAKTAEAGLGLLMKSISDNLTKYAFRHEADRILTKTGLPTRAPSVWMRPFQPAAIGGAATGVLTGDVVDALAPQQSNDALR